MTLRTVLIIGLAWATAVFIIVAFMHGGTRKNP